MIFVELDVCYGWVHFESSGDVHESVEYESSRGGTAANIKTAPNE